jgi:putative addiction module killer protein
MYPSGYNKVMEIEIELYKTASSHCPFDDWFESLRELNTRAKILTRLDRLKLGNFGDCKTLGDGIAELRVHHGPGIRIYYSKIGNKIVLLLCGGDKGSQSKDINKAKEYFKEYLSREKKRGKK